MKNEEELLAKFWNGETDLQEEQELKAFFSKNEKSELSPDSDFFNGIGSLQNIRVNSAEFDKKIMAQLRQTITHHRKRVYFYSSISFAATVILAVGIFTFSGKKEAIVIDKGVRYNDMEKAIDCADEAMNDAMAPLKQSMQSLEPIKGLEGSLLPTFKAKARMSADSNALNNTDDSAYTQR
jgi:hypothetical protein